MRCLGPGPLGRGVGGFNIDKVNASPVEVSK